MTKELFEKAKFGDRFVTRGGQEALFLRLTENAEWRLADFYVKDWGLIRVNRENGKCQNGPDIENDIVGMMPSLPSNMDDAAEKLYPYKEGYDVELPYPSTFDENKYERDAFKAGAEWQLNEDAKKHYFAQLKNIKDAWRELKKINPEIKSKPALCFYKGAEWMAGQGVKFDTKMSWLDSFGFQIGWPEDTSIFDCFNEGDKVVVQIRKK